MSIIEVTATEDTELRRRIRAHTTSKRDNLRAEIILFRATGMKQQEVAKKLGVSIVCVNKWSQRFEREGLAGLSEKPGRGRKTSIPLEIVERVITEVTRPPKPKTRWSTRSMAQAMGISPDSVRRIWHANDLKPHVVKTFKLSSDPHFEEKFWDVIGLYLDPPERALVLCCDEKTQCQALERSQLGLPLSPGHARTRTHDYIRHGTITLFAALNYLDGTLIGRTEESHTHVEWLRFLKQIDRETPKALDLHLIVDNYCTHKHEKVKCWLSRHPRLHVHFIPTGSSWMNLVERFFADLTADVVREGSFTHVRQLVTDIEMYLAQRNASPKPYRWKAKGEEILDKIRRAKQVIAQEKVH
ncbi:MAG: IS630 family transposase [Methylococcales bacterium]|nr:IS630 family transposase [Methylococcales bacterium]